MNQELDITTVLYQFITWYNSLPANKKSKDEMVTKFFVDQFIAQYKPNE